MRIIGLALGTLVLVAAIYVGMVVAHRPDAAVRCEAEARGTVRLGGYIGEEMLACARRLVKPRTHTVIVDSPGGSADHGRALGALVGARPRRLVVDGLCLSSCGNYFVPAAREVVLRPGAMIGLHGTPDPFTRAQNAARLPSPEAYEADLRERHADLIAEGVFDVEGSVAAYRAQQAARPAFDAAAEEAFAARFGVPLGWRMYREEGDDRWGFLRHLVGAPVPAPDAWTARFTDMMIVEEALMASCLPHVRIARFQETLDDSVFDAWLRRRLLLPGLYRSGTLACRAETVRVPDASAPLPPLNWFERPGEGSADDLPACYLPDGTANPAAEGRSCQVTATRPPGS